GEHRSATPKRPVRSGPSASKARGVTGSTASSNLAGPGSNPGGFAGTWLRPRPRRGPKRLRLSGKGADPAERLRIPPARQRAEPGERPACREVGGYRVP